MIAGSVWVIALAAALFGLLNPAAANDNLGGLQIGTKAPDFTLKALDGKQVKLSDYKGKPVIINFWASWCPACKAEMPDFEKTYQAYKDKGLVILAVDVGEPVVSVESFRQKYNLTFPILIDENSRVTRLYQVIPLPSTYFVDAQGVIRSKGLSQLLPDQLKQHLSKIMPGGDLGG